ncbi:MAG: type II toxin-antitoxin system death-on-curing family toxin [Bacteroidota bacterium]
MPDPIWIKRETIEAFQLDQVRRHGGRWGVRDENLLESALARPQQRFVYESDADLFDLAAAYAFGIAKNHPFIDGNKRAAFVAMAVFLFTNGQRLNAPEPEAVVTMLAVAAGEMDEAALAAWARTNSEPR